MTNRSFLARLHQRQRPAAYLELGVGDGELLRLARCRAVGIDPGYAIRAELDGPVALFRTTPEEYFSRPDPLAATGGQRFELTVLGGSTLVEVALRHLVHAERHSAPGAVAVLLDCLPRTDAQGARVRRCSPWAGDTYRLLDVLARWRGDLRVTPVDESGLGLAVIEGLDATDDVLAENYDQILTELRHPVDEQLLTAVQDRVPATPTSRFFEAERWLERQSVSAD